MAKDLTFKLDSTDYSLSPVKIERRKLYGWTECKVYDNENNECRSAGLDSNGLMVIPSGAVKLGIINSDGLWIDKSKLQTVHSDGSIAELLPSSFESVIKLDQKATPEDLLDLLVTSVYALNGEKSDELIQKIGTDIYSFRFNYRSDYEDTQAYLISNGKSLFILSGQKARFEMLTLDDRGILEEDESNFEDMDLDDLDFSMM